MCTYATLLVFLGRGSNYQSEWWFISHNTMKQNKREWLLVLKQHCVKLLIEYNLICKSDNCCQNDDKVRSDIKRGGLAVV